jgi:hypothetical protein
MMIRARARSSRYSSTGGACRGRPALFPIGPGPPPGQPGESPASEPEWLASAPD